MKTTIFYNWQSSLESTFVKICIMSRIKSFAAPHKGLRNVIAKFALCLGHTDLSNTSELIALKQLGNEMFTLLNDHVHTENEHTLRHLEERVKGASQHDISDHEKLEEVQAKLEQRLASFTGKETPDEVHAYYLDFSLFHSLYLEHIHEEETVTELLLQQHFTDEELIEHRSAIMQRLTFPILRLWLKYIIPSQIEPESFGMLSGLKKFSSKDAFEEIMATIKPEMSDERFMRLSERLTSVSLS
jgi:hypothetical protein